MSVSSFRSLERDNAQVNRADQFGPNLQCINGSPLGHALLGLTTFWQSEHEPMPQLIVEPGLCPVGIKISEGRINIHRAIAKTDHNKAQAWNDVDPLPSLSICADHVFGSVRDYWTG